ncbi:cysteine--tRNA ligase [Candidatus Babeliales bacterium]|nr:cysteine--tRNA ligase [Candidatus Babeliales bacterium]
MNIVLTNTLDKKKELFKPLIEKKLSLYVCGVTPYDHAHIGHGRCYVQFDFLVRLFRFLDYQVTYARNFTDIDDKILKRAAAENEPDFSKISQKYIDSFHADMQKLNCVSPSVEPLVTTHIQHIIKFIEQLIAQNNAYVAGLDVYFDITSFVGYGKLSGRNIDDLLSGARVEVDERKKNPGDFALWKGNDQGQFWPSPWGHGRPGWHIECSAMAQEYLGKTIDIHAGGMDLIFPHHENEIAQSEGLHHQPFARYWLHNAFVNIDKEKMSKSLGNVVALHKIFEQIDPMVLRYFFLQHHYRTPIDFSFDSLQGIQTAYKKLVAHFAPIAMPSNYTVEQLVANNPIIKEMVEALCDDLNSTKMFGILFQHFATIKESVELSQAVRVILQDVLGFTLQPLAEETVTITPEIESLIARREQARAAKDWAQADQIRDELAQKGYSVHDKKFTK